MESSRRPRRAFTAWTMLSLALGLGLGFLLAGPQPLWVERAGEVLSTAGRTWMIALQYTIVPLVVSQAFLAVLGTEKLGRLGARTMLLFGGLLVGSALLTLLLSPLLLALYHPDPALVASLRSGVEVPETLIASLGQTATVSNWLRSWLPTGVARLLRGSGLLPLLVLTLLLGVLGRQVRGSVQVRLLEVARRLAAFIMRVVGWILIFTPIGVMALTYAFARRAGFGAVSFFLIYVVMTSALLLLFTVLLYPLTVLLRRPTVTLRGFARAITGAQLVAFGTSSSLASLPAMIESARTNLRLPVAGTGFVLPLAVATFKLNMAVSAPFMFLFLGHVFGAELPTGTILVFTATMLLISFATPGIPGGNPGFSPLAAYVAAGIPIQGPLMLDAVNAVPDIFKTVLNVTADLSAATILTVEPAARPDAVPAQAVGALSE